jgi:hypothetical protein
MKWLRGLTFLVMGLCGGLLIAQSPDLAVPVLTLLLPSLLAVVFDKSPELGVARSMLTFQISACIVPIHDAWYACSGLHACMSMLCDQTTLARTWLFGALALALTKATPVALRFWEALRLKRVRARLEQQRQAIIEEWGLAEDEAP